MTEIDPRKLTAVTGGYVLGGARKLFDGNGKIFDGNGKLFDGNGKWSWLNKG